MKAKKCLRCGRKINLENKDYCVPCQIILDQEKTSPEQPMLSHKIIITTCAKCGVEFDSSNCIPFNGKSYCEPCFYEVVNAKPSNEVEVKEVSKCRTDNMIDLIVVCSVTCLECYHALTEASFKNIGIKYFLILTDPNLTLPESYNSIVLTHKTEIEQSKYILFLAQDVTFTTENWGRKIVEICDKLSDLGCAGIECVSKNRIYVGCHGNYPEEPISVNSCDGAEIIIPSKLFLERQFDLQFKWYPFMEDYACWVQFTKKMKVYCLPIRIINGGCSKPSKWVSQFDGLTPYANMLRIDHDRLLDKWNLDGFPTTTWNVYGRVSSKPKNE